MNALQRLGAWALHIPTAQDAPAPVAAPAPLHLHDARSVWTVLRRDLGVLVLLAAACIMVAVSIPATYAIVKPFHSDSVAGTILMLVAFEVGAVGCKLGTLLLPEFRRSLSVITLALLVITSLANFGHGWDLFHSAKQLDTTLAYVQKSEVLATIATICYAGLVPTLLYQFLRMAVRRAELLTTDSATRQAAQTLAPLMQAFETVAALRALAAQHGMHEVLAPVQLPHAPAQPLLHAPAPSWQALPDMQQHARIDTPEEVQYVAPVQSYLCIKCSASNPVQAGKDATKARAASARHGCPHCRAL